jgi:predicted MPP superfamily phosphohydrolase
MYILIGIGVLLVVLASLVIARIIYENRHFNITRYDIKSHKLSEVASPIHMIVLADLHNHVYGTNNDILIETIKRESPDAILIAGDLIVAKPGRDFTATLDFVKRLSGICPVYYGIGNHEYRLKLYPEIYGTMHEEYFGELKKCGVHILENKVMKLFIKNAVINICGLEIDREYYKRFTTQTLPNKYIEGFLGQSTEEFNILLAHNPNYFPDYAKWGADLTLAGHIHGGLVRLPLLGGVVSPQVEFFPKYDRGLFENAGKKMILSGGLGTHTINIRFNNPAELVTITLTGDI